MCLKLMQLLVTLFTANDIGLLHPPPHTFYWDKITMERTYGINQKATRPSEKCHLAVLLVAKIKGVTISDTNQNTFPLHGYSFF